MNADHQPREEDLDLLALGAAGALSDVEYGVLDDLLATDPDLAREYAELQTSAATLAEAATEAPPPHLRASVLDAIRNVEQLPSHESSSTPVVAAAPTPGSDGADGADTTAPSNVVPFRQRRWMVPATAAAAVVMVLVGGLIFRNVADAPADRMAEVLNDDEAITIPLGGALAGLRVIASDHEDAAVLIGSGLQPPDSGMVFQLWVLHGEGMVGMGTFTPAETGEVAMVIEDAGDEADWAVTVEPEGGSDQPTSDPVAVSPGLA